MMKAYEITALPKGGATAVSYHPALGSYITGVLGLSQGRGCGQSSGPVGLQGEENSGS